MLMKNLLARTLSVLGSVLIICSLLAILTIGIKSRNLLVAGIFAGATAWVLAWLTAANRVPSWTGMAFSLVASIVFAQRALANFWALIGIVQQQANYDAKNKCTLIILLLLMTMASMNALMMSFIYQSADVKHSDKDGSNYN